MIKKLFFICAATLVTFSGSCWSMQHDTAMLLQPTERLSTSKEDKDLKTIFSENKKFLIQHKIEPFPTAQNVNMLLHLAIRYGKYALVKEIVNAMGDLIKQYTQLYQAIRAGKEGIKELNELLKKGVSANCYNLHDEFSYTPFTRAESEYKFYRDLNPKDIVFEDKYTWLFKMTKEKWEQHNEAFYRHLTIELKKIYKFLEETIWEKEPPLDVACDMQNYDAMQLLLDHGAYDSNARARWQLKYHNR